MPRRQLVMIAVVLAAVLGAALLIWRGEGLAGGFALIALATIILLQMDARRRLSDLAADVRRNRAELRTAAARTSTQESELKELGRQLNVSARAAGKARDHSEAVLDRLDQVEGLLAQQTEDAVKHRRALHRDRRMRSRDNLTQIQALLQLHEQFSPDAPLPEVAGWAMEPTALVELVNVVARLRPRLVLECGSGTSTLWIAYALRRNGSGRVVALDHDTEYAAATAQVITEHGLEQWAHIRHAPLAPTDTPRGPMPWYSTDLTDLTGIELLVVDGPPKATGELARYPALPVLDDRLAPDARILFDDADRPDEVAVLDAWRETYSLEVEHELAGRAVLLRLRTA
ncbi:class I SAM-dependent methyltransferase [Ruania albidiflava]|uniref:class I SAM-dependent methyltransferase n=1 Tax=Ruania albidiflava TaxID=366586 RepID=UPI0003F4ADDD|nr:class I SAM-dependent methyltransferase [Ruania albidiflava]